MGIASQAADVKYLRLSMNESTAKILFGREVVQDSIV